MSESIEIADLAEADGTHSAGTAARGDLCDNAAFAADVAGGSSDQVRLMQEHWALGGLPRRAC